MPAAIAVPAIASAITGAVTVYGTHAAGKSAKRAADVQAKSDAEALAFAREQEANRRAEYEREQNDLKAQWDAQEARREPYRQAGAQALMKLSALTGLSAPAPQLGAREMPSGWTPQAQAVRRVPVSSFVRPQTRVRQMVEGGY